MMDMMKAMKDLPEAAEKFNGYLQRLLELQEQQTETLKSIDSHLAEIVVTGGTNK